MNYQLDGKRAIVCGASQGIGKAIAQELAQLGCSVVIVSRNETKLQAVCRELPGNGHSYIVADHSRHENMLAKMEAHISKPIHILVNNSGGPPGGSITEATPEQFLTAFNQHLLTNVALVRKVLPGMKELHYGRIINIISTSVKVPLKGLGVSNTIRGAVASWAKTLANELGGFGITVNNVLPGATETSRLHDIIRNKANKSQLSEEQVRKLMLAEIPAQRFGLPEEIAAVAAFLASPAAAYVNGTSIPVDGGRTGAI